MNKVNINKLVNKTEGPFVSIYLPTHRNNPENKQDPVTFKNLLKKIDQDIKKRGGDAKSYLSESYDLLEDNKFWNNTTGGLAVLIDKEDTNIYILNGSVDEKAIISDNFHLLPLLNYYEIPNDYYFLDLSKDRFSLYSYIDGSLNEEDLDIYSKFTDLFSDKDYEIEGSPTRGQSDSFHNYHTSSSVEEKEREKYFRYLKDNLGEFLKEKESKLILFGTRENVMEFKDYVDFDIYGVIDKPFNSIDKNDLYKELRDALLDKYIKDMDKRIEDLKTEIANDRGTDNQSRILKDGLEGRISELYISTESDTNINVDEIVTYVLRTGGEVILVDPEHNEIEFDIAAKYRY